MSLYTCIGKGGKYELLGLSFGAGACRNESRMVYRDVATGLLYHRTAEEFEARMELIEPTRERPCPECFQTSCNGECMEES